MRRVTAATVDLAYAPGLRRAAAAFGSVLAAAIALDGAADGAAPEKSYFRLAASGNFHYRLDYGSVQASVYNGKYSKTILWTMNAIAQFDGKALSIVKGQAVVDGATSVFDDRTQRTGATTRRPVAGTCTAVANLNGPVRSEGRVSLSSVGLSVDPGSAIKRNIGCAATESPAFHKLPGGPEFRVPPPRTSRFSRADRFFIGCSGSFSHPYNKPTGVANGHAFEGNVSLYVRFTPFPASKLADTKKWLQKLEASPSLAPPVSGATFKKCSAVR
jgi:hypothetical protein